MNLIGGLTLLGNREQVNKKVGGHVITHKECFSFGQGKQGGDRSVIGVLCKV